MASSTGNLPQYSLSANAAVVVDGGENEVGSRVSDPQWRPPLARAPFRAFS